MIDTKNISKIAINVLKSMVGYRMPMKVTQYITIRCNLNCEYCGRKNLKINELSTEDVLYYIRGV